VFAPNQRRVDGFAADLAGGALELAETRIHALERRADIAEVLATGRCAFPSAQKLSLGLGVGAARATRWFIGCRRSSPSDQTVQHGAATPLGRESTRAAARRPAG